MDQPLIVSPSLLGRYFFLNCARMLRYSATPAQRKSADGVPSRPFIGSILQQAILEGGYEWEESLMKRLGSTVRTARPSTEDIPVRDLVFTQEQFLESLQKEKPPGYFYQATLNPTSEFYKQYGIDPSRILFPPCRPDLLQVINEPKLKKLRVIDIKASSEARFSHKIQAVLYALILKNLLKSAGITGWEADLETCGIWLYDTETPQQFRMQLIQEPLETFLRVSLPSILLQPANEANWCANFRCEWCDYWDHCSSEAVEQRDISLLPYLRPEAKIFLGDVKTPVSTIPQLSDYLKKPESRDDFRLCAHLIGKHERLSVDVTANQTNSVMSYGSSTIAFPKGEHVAIILTLQGDPLTGGICAAGIRVYGAKDLGLQQDNWCDVAESGNEKGFRKLRTAFINRLERIMRAVDVHNRNCKDWSDQKSLQCYVFDDYEEKLQQQMLKEALEDTDPSLAQKALHLFFHFQTEELVSAEDHPGAEVPNPLIVVVDILRQVTALPLPITYRLARVSEVLQPSQFPFVYDEKVKFSFPISNRLRSDSLYLAWQKPKDLQETTTEIMDELDGRLKGAYSVIRGLREKISDRLFAWPPKFLFPQSADFKQPILSRLAFMSRYEKVLRYLEVRMSRALPLPERLDPDLPIAIAVRLESHASEKEWIAVLEPESEHHLPETGAFASWLMTHANNAGDREQMRFHDLMYKDKPYVPKGIGVMYSAITEVYAVRSKTYVKLELTTGKDSPRFRNGDRCLLHPRYTDYTSGRVLSRLKDLDGEDATWFVRLLDNPANAQKKIRLHRNLRSTESMSRFLHPFYLRSSQETALLRVLQHKFQLIWGPPGTGKTHFLSTLVCSLASVFSLEKKSFSVLITAFTHAALENCLKKVKAAASSLKGNVPAMDFFKLDSWQGQDLPSGIQTGYKADPRSENNKKGCVIAGTVYAVKKYLQQPFDLVLIDEGSQLPVPESSIPISLLASDGRLVIAGDDKQLPPIIKGIYPEPEEGKAHLYSSIFECLRYPDIGRDLYTSQLQECFRMNSTLCSFPAAAIYGEGFKPASKTIASNRLALKPAARKSIPWLEYVLDPKYSLVLLVLDGVHSLAESPIEADLVSHLALALRSRLLNKNGRPYRDDKEFWEKGLFIVSPHHVQIRQIYSKLTEARDWTRSPFVETVEKMQGREADAVIISYGVADADFALLEGEFIYSLNRLNVAITRARSKAIICLSAPLLSPHTIAFGNDEMIEGLDFMLKLKRYLKDNGEAQQFELENYENRPSLTILRM